MIYYNFRRLVYNYNSFNILTRGITNKKLYKMEDVRDDLIKIFLKSVEAVQPDTIIKKNIKLCGNTLHVHNQAYHLNKNCYIVGFGKAVYGMSKELESILGCHLVWGAVSIPADAYKRNAMDRLSNVMYMEGAEHNLPDEDSEKAAKQIRELVRNVSHGDLLFVLISGGGSALLPGPIPPVTLYEKCALIKVLSRSGADIFELNSVRKRLSNLKRGGLAVLAYPAKVIALILSDVIGDSLDIIASGPTVPNTDSPKLAETIILKYINNTAFQLPNSIGQLIKSITLNTCQTGNISVPVISEGKFEHVSNYIIGNNKIAIESAAKQARKHGHKVTIMSNSVSGNVTTISDIYAKIAAEIYKVLNSSSTKEKLSECLKEHQASLNISNKAIEELLNVDFVSSQAICLIFGGEPIVYVKGTGKGGRNQQLALEFSVDIQKTMCGLSNDLKPMTVALLSCGTDGIDGPTDAAGAIGFYGLCELAATYKLDPCCYIKRNNSYKFYKQFYNGLFLIRTGHTGTNVMDIHVLLINP